MAQVIIERPRIGSRMPTKGKGYERRTARLGWDEAAKSEGMKARGGRGKVLNENLAPLRRFLAGQVGRPWVKVHAEICRHLDRNSPVQDHVRDHLEDYVAINVMVQNGELCRADGYGVGRPLYSLFYVCPNSGILKKNRRPSRRLLDRYPKLTHLDFLGDGTALVRYRGAWSVITLRSFPPATPNHFDFVDDELFDQRLDRGSAKQIYGRAIYTVAVRPACKREIRRAVSSYPRTNLAR